MATVRERAAHLVNHMFSLVLCLSICDFGCFPFRFRGGGGTLVLILPAPGHWFNTFYFFCPVL